MQRNINKNIHPITFLQQLHSSSPSQTLLDYLSTLKDKKATTEESFVTGIKAFIKIANFHPENRKEFYGNLFLGLHYSSDLAELWNAHSKNTIKNYELNKICPPEWSLFAKDGFLTLAYKGTTPSMALDALLQGPTVIDCGIFCQLSIWFGIRYMLGNELFNKLIGNAPFYLTQINYSPIENIFQPYLGNPLYPFFSDKNESTRDSRVKVVHIANHNSYLIKHPGGNSAGENCIVIDDAHTLFNPYLEVNFNLTRSDVEKFLFTTFNNPQNNTDFSMIDLYDEFDPGVNHPTLKMNFRELIDNANKLADLKVNEEEWNHSIAKNNERCLIFDFLKFQNWFEKMINRSDDKLEYVPQLDNQLNISLDTLMTFPFENRNLNFSNFKSDTPLQQKLFSLSLIFCQTITQNKPCQIAISGIGIGKTSAAVCCAKELMQKGKKILWISDIIASIYIDKLDNATSNQEYADVVKSLLNDSVDVIFLDGTLSGKSAYLLMEAIYSWYVNHSNKGLFITSNYLSTSKKALGQKISITPFSGYTSEQHQNSIIINELNVDNLSTKPAFEIYNLTDDEVIKLFQACKTTQSIGITITKGSFSNLKCDLSQIEFIPALPVLAPIIFSLAHTGELGEAYDELTEHQKKWIKRFPIYKENNVINHMSIGIKLFEKTMHEIIAVELLAKQSGLNDDCIAQLIRVIHFAHDHGGKKVLLINHTQFSHQELWTKIKEKLPDATKKSTIARIDSLFFSNYLLTSRSKIDDKNIKVEKVEQKPLIKVSSHTLLWKSPHSSGDDNNMPQATKPVESDQEKKFSSQL